MKDEQVDDCKRNVLRWKMNKSVILRAMYLDDFTSNVLGWRINNSVVLRAKYLDEGRINPWF